MVHSRLHCVNPQNRKISAFFLGTRNSHGNFPFLEMYNMGGPYIIPSGFRIISGPRDTEKTQKKSKFCNGNFVEEIQIISTITVTNCLFVERFVEQIADFFNKISVTKLAFSGFSVSEAYPKIIRNPEGIRRPPILYTPKLGKFFIFSGDPE